MEELVFATLTRLDQRLAWERKKDRYDAFYEYFCSCRAFDLSSLFLHALGTNSTQKPSQGSEYAVYLSCGAWSCLDAGSSVFIKQQC